MLNNFVKSSTRKDERQFTEHLPKEAEKKTVGIENEALKHSHNYNYKDPVMN